MRNDEIEEAIRRAPEDLDGYEVYADWLLEHGEVHGEAILFAVRTRRAGGNAADLATLTAEARLLQDRRRILGPLGELPRGQVECDFDLGFVRALRIYSTGDRAAWALRQAFAHRACALLQSVFVCASAAMRPPHVNEDKPTVRAIWKTIHEVGIPRWVTAVAVPLLSDDVPGQLDVLAHVRSVTFPLRNASAVATHVHRLPALERLTFTSAETRPRPITLEALIDHAPNLATVPRLQLATELPFRYDVARLRESLPNLTLGWSSGSSDVR